MRFTTADGAWSLMHRKNKRGVPMVYKDDKGCGVKGSK